MTEANALTMAIEKGDREAATRLTQEAIDSGRPLEEILDAMVTAMDKIGYEFQCNRAYIPEMLIAARATKEAMALLEPLLVDAGFEHELTAVIGTVQGDLHDVGKNLVAMMWKGANFDVVDLGHRRCARDVRGSRQGARGAGRWCVCFAHHHDDRYAGRRARGSSPQSGRHQGHRRRGYGH